MVLPKTTRQDGTDVSMYMPCLTDHLPDLDIKIAEVKRVVKYMGGGGGIKHIADSTYFPPPHQTILSCQRRVMYVDQ